MLISWPQKVDNNLVSLTTVWEALDLTFQSRIWWQPLRHPAVCKTRGWGIIRASTVASYIDNTPIKHCDTVSTAVKLRLILAESQCCSILLEVYGRNLKKLKSPNFQNSCDLFMAGWLTRFSTGQIKVTFVLRLLKEMSAKIDSPIHCEQWYIFK